MRRWRLHQIGMDEKGIYQVSGTGICAVRNHPPIGRTGPSGWIVAAYDPETEEWLRRCSLSADTCFRTRRELMRVLVAMMSLEAPPARSAPHDEIRIVRSGWYETRDGRVTIKRLPEPEDGKRWLVEHKGSDTTDPFCTTERTLIVAARVAGFMLNLASMTGRKR